MMKERNFFCYLSVNDSSKQMLLLMHLKEICSAREILLSQQKKNTMMKIYRKVASENHLDSSLRKNKRKFFDLLEEDRYAGLKKELVLANQSYHKCKRLLDDIEKLIVLERNHYHNLIPKKCLDEYEQPFCFPCSTQEAMEYQKFLGQDFPFIGELVTCFDDIKSGKYMRKYGFALQGFLPHEVGKLFSEFDDLDPELLSRISILGQDVVRNKLRTIRRGVTIDDDVERAFLKKLISMFQGIQPNVSYEDVADTSSYYSIMERLIDNDHNYHCIEKLLTNVEKFRNARKNDCHILMLLLDKFVCNYKLKLVNQGLPYVEPRFYKEVIKLFLDRGAKLNDVEVQSFCAILDDFSSFCKAKRYRLSSSVFEDILEIRSSISHGEEEFSNTEVYYDMIDTLLCNGTHYSQVEELLEQSTNFLDARKSGEHILMRILDRLICEQNLDDGSSMIANSNFYKKVLQLYFAKGVKLTDDEVIEFCSKLDSLEEMYQKRADDVSFSLLCNVSSIRFLLLEENAYAREWYALKNVSIPDTVQSYKDKGYPSCFHAFMLEGIDKYAFSVDHSTNGDMMFGVYVVDNSKLVDMDSLVLQSVKAGKDLLPKFDREAEYPAMSFVYTLYSDHKLSPLQVYPSVVRVEQVYGEDELNVYRENPDLKNTFCFLNQLCDNQVDLPQGLSYQKRIDEMVSRSLSYDIAMQFQKSKIPFIYEVFAGNNLELMASNHNAICDLLTKIPKTEAHQVFDIISQPEGSYYVPDYQQGSKINLDTASFLGVYLLDTLHKIQNHRYDVCQEVNTISTYLDEMNAEKGYVPRDTISKNEGVLKQFTKRHKNNS